MAPRQPFAKTLGAAWLLFLVVVVALVAGSVGAGWLSVKLAELGWPVWLRFLPTGLALTLGVRLLVRRMK